MSHIYQNMLSHKLLTTLCWVGIIFSAERVSQHFLLPEPIHEGGLFRWFKNIALGLINKLLLPFFTIPLMLFFTSHQYLHRSVSQSGVIYLLADIILLDMTSYLFHVISHKVPFLWRFHRAHHTDKAFDVTTGLRIHFGELILANIFRGLPIVMLGIPFKSVLIFEFLLAMEGLFHHTNIRLPRKISQLAGYIITMPDRHVVHHHALREDTDSNFGFIFIWWDKLFGSFNNANRDPEWLIGLEDRSDQSLIEILIKPLNETRQHIWDFFSSPKYSLTFSNRGKSR